MRLNAVDRHLGAHPVEVFVLEDAEAVVAARVGDDRDRAGCVSCGDRFTERDIDDDRLAEAADGLVEGLLSAAVAFDQRLPELWSGEGAPVPYPAACRPQAWSAAAAVVVARRAGVFGDGTGPASEG